MGVYNKIYDPDIYKLVLQENKNIVDDFISELKSQKKSEGTISQYKNDLRILNIWIYKKNNNKSILDLKKRDFRNFVLWCEEDCQMSNARTNRIMSAIRMLTSYLEDDEDDYEDYERSAAAKIKGLPKETVREVIFIPNEDIEKLYNFFMENARYKEATLLALLYESGCRKNEILQVRRDSITDNGNATNQVKGKRSKYFKCLYFQRTKDAFKKYEATRTDNCELLFVNSTGTPANENSLYAWVTKWVDDFKKVTGHDYTGLNVHSFRHCFIENMCNGTHWLCKDLNLGSVELSKVKILAHHSNVSTTDGYRANTDEKDIEELFGIKLS